jgi:hypothetical protein
MNAWHSIMHRLRVSIFFICVFVDMAGSERPTMSTKKKFAWTRFRFERMLKGG